MSIRSCKISFSFWIRIARALKKTEVKVELLCYWYAIIMLLIWIDMLLMVEKRIRGGLCNKIHQYANTNNKYIKDYDKNKES